MTELQSSAHSKRLQACPSSLSGEAWLTEEQAGSHPAVLGVLAIWILKLTALIYDPSFGRMVDGRTVRDLVIPETDRNVSAA